MRDSYDRQGAHGQNMARKQTTKQSRNRTVTYYKIAFFPLICYILTLLLGGRALNYRANLEQTSSFNRGGVSVFTIKFYMWNPSER